MSEYVELKGTRSNKIILKKGSVFCIDERTEDLDGVFCNIYLERGQISVGHDLKTLLGLLGIESVGS